MKKLFMMAVSAAVISMPAMAADDSAMHKDEKAKMKTEMVFKEADTNKDGMISKAEHDSMGSKMFMEADTNKDGSLSTDEVRAEKVKEMEKMEAMHPEAGKNK